MGALQIVWWGPRGRGDGRMSRAVFVFLIKVSNYESREPTLSRLRSCIGSLADRA